jgi:Pyruvate/2-oxoacid:ferredoxin oxidoreductase gamma subunit
MTRYTNFILTVIAVALIGILFKGSIISSAKAASRYSHWKEMNIVAANVETILADVKQLKNICRK